MTPNKSHMSRLEDIGIEQVAASLPCPVLPICFPRTMVLDSLVGSQRLAPTSRAGTGDVLVAEMEARAARPGSVQRLDFHSDEAFRRRASC